MVGARGQYKFRALGYWKLGLAPNALTYRRAVPSAFGQRVRPRRGMTRHEVKNCIGATTSSMRPEPAGEGGASEAGYQNEQKPAYQAALRHGGIEKVSLMGVIRRAILWVVYLNVLY